MTDQPASGGIERAHWGLLAVLLLSLGLNLFPLWWGLPASNAWAFDEIRPTVVLNGMGRAFSDGWGGPYPPLHYYLLSVLYWPVVAMRKAGWIEMTGVQQMSLLYVLGRSLSVLMATSTVYMVYRSARLLGDRWQAVLAALIVAVMAPFVFYAKTVNLEAPYLFWFVLSVFFLLRVLDRHRLRDYLALAATATLAACTKDQAVAFYVLLPIGLWWSLYKHESEAATVTTSPWRLLIDKRLLLSGLLALVLFVLVHNLAFNYSGFEKHFRWITRRSPSLFHLYEPTLRGYAALTVQTVKHLAFSLSWPLLVASFVGILATLRQPRRHRLRLALLGVALSYYVFFILVIRHNYVRFLIPICILLSFFAADALRRLGRSERVPRFVSILVVAGVFTYASLRAVSVDFLMHWDSRYEVEAWLSREIGADEQVVAAGRQNLLPRGLRTYRWRRIRRRGLEALTSPRVDYVVISTTDLWAQSDKDFRAALADGALGAELVLRHRGQPPFNILDTSGIFTNLDKLNPEIEIYRLPRPDDTPQSR